MKKPHLDRMTGDLALLLQRHAGWSGDMAVQIAQLDEAAVIRGLSDGSYSPMPMPMDACISCWRLLRRAVQARIDADERTALVLIAQAQARVERWREAGMRVHELPIVSVRARYGPDDWPMAGFGSIRHVLRLWVELVHEPSEDDREEIVRAAERAAGWLMADVDVDERIVLLGLPIDDEEEVAAVLAALATAAGRPCPLVPPVDYAGTMPETTFRHAFGNVKSRYRRTFQALAEHDDAMREDVPNAETRAAMLESRRMMAARRDAIEQVDQPHRDTIQVAVAVPVLMEVGVVRVVADYGLVRATAEDGGRLRKVLRIVLTLCEVAEEPDRSPEVQHLVVVAAAGIARRHVARWTVVDAELHGNSVVLNVRIEGEVVAKEVAEAVARDMDAPLVFERRTEERLVDTRRREG